MNKFFDFLGLAFSVLVALVAEGIILAWASVERIRNR